MSESTVCDCHAWPTVTEMHQYVEALEARLGLAEKLVDALKNLVWIDGHERRGNSAG